MNHDTNIKKMIVKTLEFPSSHEVAKKLEICTNHGYYELAMVFCAKAKVDNTFDWATLDKNMIIDLYTNNDKRLFDPIKLISKAIDYIKQTIFTPTEQIEIRVSSLRSYVIKQTNKLVVAHFGDILWNLFQDTKCGETADQAYLDAALLQ